jgi:hypothetical protein
MRRSTAKNKGQALVLFLGFSAAMVGMMLVAFNSGQVTNAKMRAMNAADAAAYSGAVWQARTLNFQAYMNRAMIVNEITIAQSVSLRSWVAYLNKFVTNVNYITEFVPYLGSATTAVAKVLDKVDDSVQKVLPPFDLVMRAANKAEHELQGQANTFGVIVAQDLASNVAALNGATMSPGNVGLFAANEKKWIEFTKGYEGKSTGRVGKDERTRMREVTLNSRDGFTQARDWTAGLPLAFQLRKQGGTDLLDFDSWKGLDSAELRTFWNPAKGDWSTKVPLGWGGAQSYSPRKISKVGRHGDINEWNDYDGRLANADANSRSKAKDIKLPFQGYRDISNPSVKDADLRLPFAVEVVIKGDKIPTASTFGAKAKLSDWSTIEHDPHYTGKDTGAFALAEACVTYARPYGGERRDGAKEFPSLFNPYWRASLATESRRSRSIVDATKGLPPISALLGGTGTCS